MIRKSQVAKGTACVMVFLFLFFGFMISDMEAGKCEEAFFKCWEDPYWAASPAGGVYCAAGYLFCKKYIKR